MDKDKQLEDIIKKLCEYNLTEKSANEIIENLKEVYEDKKYRHKYSKITDIILNSKKSKKDGMEQIYMNLAQNIRAIQEGIEKKEDIQDSVKRNFEKLYDHINLECLRLQDIDDKIKESKENYEKLDKDYKDLKESLDKQQTQYITILGIFASIVLAFVGGLVFSTSVLANIEKASIYRLVFVMSFIALFFGNILYALFSFLSKIILNKNQQVALWRKPIVWFDIITCFIMLVDVLLYFFGLDIFA